MGIHYTAQDTSPKGASTELCRLLFDSALVFDLELTEVGLCLT